LENELGGKIPRKRLFPVSIIVIIAIIIAIAAISKYAYDNIEAQLFNERSVHLNEITEKVSDVIDTIISSKQSEATLTANLFSDSEDSGGIYDFLEKTYRQMELSDDTSVVAFTSRGMMYSSDGKRAMCGNMNMLIDSAEQMVVIDSLPYDSGTLCMIFLSRLDKPKELGGETFTHVAIVRKLDAMSLDFNVSSFGDNFSLYIIKKSGARIYRNEYSVKLFDGYNVLTAMSELEFLHGSSADELRKNVSEGSVGSFEYKDANGTNYFVSNAPINANDWSVLVFVPSSVIGSSSGGFLGIVIGYFCVIAAAIVLLFSATTFITVSSRKDKERLKQQEETNILLEAAARKAQDASKAKSDFLSSMSHDIRTPINGIIGMTDIAMKHYDEPDKVLDCLRKISYSSDHLLSLINDVLDMSRVETGKTQAAHEPMNLFKSLGDCTTIIEGQLLSRDVEFITEYDINYPHIIGDDLHLRQILINILGNSVKFTPDGGKIWLRVKQLSADSENVSYRFEIEDTGIGMSEEFMQHIFEPFSQEEGGSRTNYKGTGLGMAITKQLVTILGGDIEVKSKLNEGSFFAFDLTFGINADASDEGEEDTVAEISGLNILLVEDNELNLEIAQNILYEAGANVSTAENGLEAVDLLQNSEPNTFDIVLMDVMMPVMDGLTASREIRASHRADLKTIPIIAMTANAYREDIEKALDAGMNDHIAKPIDVSKLFKVISHYKTEVHST
jgi:signal transduction histidine kinase/ActR/RegA family two-component response regulator